MKIINLLLLIIITISLTGCVGYFDHAEKMINVKSKAELNLNDAVVNSDTSFILGQLSMYYSENKKYPDNLKILSDFSNNIIKTKDPIGNDYEYKVVADDNYELCFTFNNNTANGYKKGRNCKNAPRPIK